MRPVGNETITDLPAQLDTAADRTVVPLDLMEELGVVLLDEIPVLGFGGFISNAPTCLVRVPLRGKTPVMLKVFAPRAEPHILLGRDILNRYRLWLDGPRLLLELS